MVGLEIIRNYINESPEMLIFIIPFFTLLSTLIFLPTEDILLLMLSQQENLLGDKFIVFLSVVIALVIGDLIFYMLGKYGTKLVLRFILRKDRASFPPDLEKKLPYAIVILRFVPGIRALPMYISGIIGLKIKTFLLFDFIGCFFSTIVFINLYSLLDGDKILLFISNHYIYFILAVGLISFLTFKLKKIKKDKAPPSDVDV